MSFHDIETYCTNSITSRFSAFAKPDFLDVRVKMGMPVQITFALPIGKYDICIDAAEHAQTMSRTLGTKTGFTYQCTASANVTRIDSYGNVVIVTYRLLGTRPSAIALNFKQATLLFFLVLLAFVVGMLFQEIRRTL